MALSDFRRKHGGRSLVLPLLFGVLPAAWATFAAVGSARAAVEFDGLFSSGGVLQRGVTVPLFGTGDDGDDVVVSIQGKSASTKVKDGRWRVELDPLEAGGPYVLSLSGTSTSTIRNVFVGDVWVCAGEANMQSPVQAAEGASAASFSRKNRMLHFFSVKRTGSETPVDRNEAKWSDGLSTTVGAFSAVGYYFGRDIQAATDVPVGLIACNHYASSAEAWTSSETLLADPALKHHVDDATGRIVWQTPGRLYNGMVLPIAGYAIKGVICYHGETNVERAAEYKTVFSLLIADWRKAWNRPDLPFLFVQLSGYKPATSKPDESKLAELREAQAIVAKEVPHTGMIVSTDLGDAYNQIPRVKEPVGKRLGFAARVLVYGEKFEYLGPTLKEAVVVGDTAIVSFDHRGDGLLAKEKSKVLGFMLAGDDGEFVNAEGEVVGTEVFVRSPELKEPKRLRYNWVDVPVGNLFNKDGFPAAPFQSVLAPSATRALAADGRPLPSESVTFDGKTLKLAFDLKKEEERRRVYVPEGQQLKSWEESASIFEFPKGEDPSIAAKSFVESAQKDPQTHSFEIVEDKEKNEVIFDFAVRTADPNFAEFNIYKFSKRPEGGVVAQAYGVRKYKEADAKALLADLQEFRKHLREKMVAEGVTVLK